jgi:hypothetical protein
LSYGGTRCEAANHCANVGATANYYSFDLHYLKQQQEWQCVLYFEGNKDTAYFDVEDSNVGEVYGYTTWEESFLHQVRAGCKVALLYLWEI